MSLSESCVTASLPTNYEYYTSNGIKHGLNANQSYFTLNDKLIRIYSGAMHYFRVPRAYWRDRLKKIRAAGLNSVETYVPWNLHEPESGNYDFGSGGSELEDFLHLDEFLNTAKEEDLFVILRTGPYICAEYNFGGFPAWLLREKTMGFRTSESTYMKYVTRYFNVLLTLLAAFQFTQGGPVIAFQVENEYGGQESGKHQPDKVYLEQLHQLFLNNGIVELLVTSDSPLSHGDKGTLPGIFLQTANLGSTVDKQLDKLLELQPGRPLMVMEFWIGWYDYWGTNHTGKSDRVAQKAFEQILARNASFNIYMFLGGTNFRFNNGALLGYKAITTSYDYDSPLSENGAYRNKYYIVKELVAAANPIKTYVPEPPALIPPIIYNATKIQKILSFRYLLEHNSPPILRSKNVISMEKLDINNKSGQSNGYLLYRKENVNLSENSILTIEGNVCDAVLVLVNGELIAPKQLKYLSDLDNFGFWSIVNSSVTLNNKSLEGATVDLVVEEMGRTKSGKYYQYNQTHKGLWQGNVTINNENIYDWILVPLEMKKQWINELQGWEDYGSAFVGPAMYKSILHIEDKPKDTFVDIRGWGKGKYDFGSGGSEYEDFLHLDEFLNTAKEEDLFVILRTGPYICSEYNFGGFPAWLLREKTMGFRTSEPTYIKYVTRYFNVLLTLLAAFQFTQGGPVIAFQVENEYGNQEAGAAFQPDKVYLEQLRQLFLKNGIVELLVTSDSPLSHGTKGTLPGLLLQTANLGATVNEQLDKLLELQPGRPLMVMEFWIGWFDFWGSNHTGKSDENTRKYLGQILDRNASFNTYMFHGGTNFGFNNGANVGNGLIDNSGFKAITTSYDYDSPLTENGAYRNKYYIVKELVAAANPIKTFVPEPPEIISPVVYNSTKIQKILPFKTLLEKNAPVKLNSKNVISMENLDINNHSGQANGYIVYRKENVDLSENSVLIIEGHVCDTVLVLVNGELIAPKQLKHLSDLDNFGFWRLGNSSVILNDKAIQGATVDLVVEEMGRVNGGKYYQYNHTHKGLWQGNITINNENVYDWTIVPLELKKQWINGLQGWENPATSFAGPAIYNTILHVDNEPRDTFIDIRGWGKGMIFVNGFALGRYVALGPQRTLYLPAPLLVKGDNEINFLEHFYAPDDGLITYADELILEDVH